MITTYMPALQDLWFRQQFMTDKATMSYNVAWGGTIPFPETEWESWYEHWLIHHENKRFYRYLKDLEKTHLSERSHITMMRNAASGLRM